MTLLDRFGGLPPGHSAAIALTGRNQRPRRFIHPPAFEWDPVPDAARYVVAGYADGGRTTGDQAQAAPLFELEVTNPAVALDSAWAEVPCGRVRLAILALGAGEEVLGASKVIAFHKGTGWGGPDGASPEARAPRLGWTETATQIMAWLAQDVGRKRYDPAAPPYFWHSAVNRTGDEVLQRGAWPSRHNPLVVEGFLAYNRMGADAALRAEALRRARGVAEFTMRWSTPDDFAYAHLPYHGIAHGSAGMHGGGRTDVEHVVEPNKAGAMGEAYVRLFETTRDGVFLDAAQRIASTLCCTQRPDGSWPYRVNARNGEVVEDYTSAGVFALLFFDALRRVAPDERYERAYASTLAWLLEHPVCTGRWENMHDDMAYSAPYENTGVLGALHMGRFLLDHVRDDPRFLALARGLSAWIEDNFVLYAMDGDPNVPFRPYVPSVAEQWRVYKPINNHTAQWALLQLQLWRVTGDESHRERAVAAANVLTHCQLRDGRPVTWIPDADTGIAHNDYDVYGCAFFPMKALLLVHEAVAGAAA